MMPDLPKQDAVRVHYVLETFVERCLLGPNAFAAFARVSR
jgi:hypothetical protein